MADEDQLVTVKSREGVGEFLLRVARDRAGRDDRRTLSKIINNEDRRFIAGKLLEEKVAEEVGEGFTFADLIKWIIENPEKFKVFLDLILSLFNPPVPVPV